MVDNNIKRMIDSDIKRCELVYKAYIGSDLNDDEVEELRSLDSNAEDFLSLFMGMHSRYSSLINNFPNDINLEDLDCEAENKRYKLVQYFKNVIEKLNAFKRMGYSEMKNEGLANIYIHNENNNQNENNLSNIQFSFQDAKQKIENMSALMDNEIEEILQKINQLESIINSSDRKSKKWENAKDIIKWIADKSFDVAKIILPLVLKIE